MDAGGRATQEQLPRGKRSTQEGHKPSYIKHSNPSLSKMKKDRYCGLFDMAEREGFEPSVRVNVHTLSRRAP